eukprot:6491324-Prymnesium_polylepis.1
MGTSRLPAGSRAACRALCAINRERRREWRPDVFDTNGAALPCTRDVAVSGTPIDRMVDHVCLGAVPAAAD